jgi:hypothetical protein
MRPGFGPVPACYRGLWRRTLLQAGDLRDTASTVYWLQTERWHADIRIPAARPSFEGVTSLAQCNPAQRRFLATQQGFYGLTEVDTSVQPDTCRWHRLADFQPPAVSPDAGALRLDGGLLVETGLHEDYLEHWERLPGSDHAVEVLTQNAADGALLLRAGNWAMRVLPRRVSWPAGLAAGMPLEAAMEADGADEIALLDFEISIIRITDIAWTIQHSTLPWLEGTVMLPTLCQVSR